MDFETREVSFFVLLKSCIPQSLDCARGATAYPGTFVPSSGRVFRSAPLHHQRSDVSALVAVSWRVCALSAGTHHPGVVIGRKSYDGLGQIAPDRSC